MALHYKYASILKDLEIISKKSSLQFKLSVFPSPATSLALTMSGKCGNCDCSDSSNCVKKGNSYGAVIMENEKSYFDAIDMDVPAAEHNDKCQCNPCNCKDCHCGK